MNGINAELVTEFAKDKVWENNTEVFKNQAYLFGKQSYRMSRCRDKVDVIVTDSPLPLSIFYNNNSSLTENFNNSIMDVFNSYNNVNYFLLRTKPYNSAGRHQSEEESDALKKPMIAMLKKYNIDYIEVKGEISGYDWIVNDLLSKINTIKEEKNLINATDIKMKPPWVRWFCTHVFTGGVRKVYDNKGRKRHARICLKCGKRDYID